LHGPPSRFDRLTGTASETETLRYVVRRLGLEPQALSSQELLKRFRLKLLDYAHVLLSR